MRCIRNCLFFFQAEDGIRDLTVTGVQTCALPIWAPTPRWPTSVRRSARAPPAVAAHTASAGVRPISRTASATQKAMLLVYEDPGLQSEIGRASCRERVWIAVVDGASNRNRIIWTR